jgi:hypothetical protein
MASLNCRRDHGAALDYLSDPGRTAIGRKRRIDEELSPRLFQFVDRPRCLACRRGQRSIVRTSLNALARRVSVSAMSEKT